MSIRSGRIAAAALFSLGLLAQGSQGAGFVPEKSEITFVSKQMGVELQGRFRKFDGDIVFHPADLAASKARIEVDLASVDLGAAESEAEVRGKDWFQVASFPKGVFQSTQIRAKGPDHYEAVGKFTLKGITRELTVPISVRRIGNQSVAEGGFVMKRTDYNIGQGAWADPEAVAIDVSVKFRFTLLEMPGK
ncbi:MAG: YceI family protein [Pseudomonadota bacterium]|nr:YceI family protein [Pseudomonadota bacterium]